MIEEVFRLRAGAGRVVEKVLLDENLHYLHMILGEGDGLPEHDTNSTLYMTVIRGNLTISLGGNPAREYDTGTLLKIPDKTKMKVDNRHMGALELIVVKAPAPTNAPNVNIK